MSNSESRNIGTGLRVTWVGALVNLLLAAFKLAGGLVGQSQALVADAIHSLSDLASDMVVLFGLKEGSKTADEGHPFGHGRIETLSSTLVALLLLIAAVYIGFEAGLGIYHRTEVRPSWIAVIVAMGSIGAKEWLYRYTVRAAKEIKSTAMTANAWHHRSDALSSVAVLLGVTGAAIHPGLHILDPCAAILVSILIFGVGIDILLESVREFTDAGPNQSVLDEVRSCAENTPRVMGVHDVKVRSSGGRYQMQLHIVVDGKLTVAHGHSIAKEVEQRCLQNIDGTTDVVVHVDPTPE